MIEDQNNIVLMYIYTKFYLVFIQYCEHTSLFTDFQDAVAEFAQTVDIHISNIDNIMAAFIHKSYLIANHKRLQKQHEDNERLSVLGESV